MGSRLNPRTVVQLAAATLIPLLPLTLTHDLAGRAGPGEAAAADRLSGAREPMNKRISRRGHGPFALTAAVLVAVPCAAAASDPAAALHGATVIQLDDNQLARRSSAARW